MKTILYLGTDPKHFKHSGHLIHYPVIKIVPRSLEHPEIAKGFAILDKYTHCIFTSKNAVKVFFEFLGCCDKVGNKTLIAIGQVTAFSLRSFGLEPHYIADEETQEGVIQLLQNLHLKNAHFFLPRSALSRPILTQFFQDNKIPFCACDLYDTVFQAPEPKPDLTQVDEIVFTSPSTVRAFFAIFSTIPDGKKCVAIGPVTERELILQTQH